MSEAEELGDYKFCVYTEVDCSFWASLMSPSKALCIIYNPNYLA